jgi:hypothetical protein
MENKYKFCPECLKKFSPRQDECGIFGHQKLENKTYTETEINHLIEQLKQKKDNPEVVIPKRSVKICPVCQTKNEASARRCKFDGELLLTVKEVLVEIGEEIKAFKLQVCGQELKFELKMGSELIFGRKATEGLACFAENLYISRQHFSIYTDGYSYYIKDLGSKNGTSLNNVNLNPLENKTMIKNNDLIKIHQIEVIFKC